MKRLFIYFSILGMALGITAFQCASSELTGAKLYINQKQYEKAKESLQKEVEKNPASDEGWYLLGFLFGEEGNIPKMLESFDKSVQASKKFEPQITESKKYYWAINFNKGVRYYNNAVNVTYPDSAKMFFEKAIEVFNYSIMCQPDSIVSYQNLVTAYYNVGRIDDAIPYLEKLLKIDNTTYASLALSEVYNEKAKKYMESYSANKNAADSLKAIEIYKKSISVLEDAKQKFPKDEDVLVTLTNTYINSGQEKVAMNTVLALLEKDPNNKVYNFTYGTLQFNAGKYEDAANYLQKAVDLDPKYDKALYNLIASYINWGLDLRQKAEQAESGDKSYIEKFQKAADYAKKAIEITPDNPTLYERLGQAYANLGMQKESVEAFQKADDLRKN